MSIDKAVDSARLDSGLTAVANAIRTKGCTSAQLSFPAGMASAINAIQVGITPSGTKSITANGNGIDVTNYARVDVNVPTSDIDITVNKEYTVTWTDGYRWKNSGTETASANGYSASNRINVSDASCVLVVWGTSGYVSGKYYGRLMRIGNSDMSSFNALNAYMDCNLPKCEAFGVRSGYGNLELNKITGEDCHIYSVTFN